MSDKKVGFKVCSHCKEEKPNTDFNKRSGGKDSLQAHCKVCVSAYKKVYNAENREKRAAYQKVYDFENRQAKAVSNSNVRAVNYKIEGVILLQEWKDLCEKHNYTCLCCGKKEPEVLLGLDHVKPLGLGGSNTISNIQPLCKSCNRGKYMSGVDYRKKD